MLSTTSVLIHLFVLMSALLRCWSGVDGANTCSNMTTSATCCGGQYNCLTATTHSCAGTSSFTCSQTCTGGSCVQCSWCSAVGYCQAVPITITACQYSSCSTITSATFCRSTTSCSWCSTLGYCTATTSNPSSSCINSCSNLTTSSTCSIAASCSWCSSLGGYCRSKTTSTTSACAANCNALAATNSTSCTVAPQCQWCTTLNGFCTESTANGGSCYTFCQNRTSQGSAGCVALSLCQWCPQHNGRCKLQTETCVTATQPFSKTSSALMPSLSVTNSLTPSRQRTPTKVSTPSKTFTRITASLEASPTYHHETIFRTPSNSSSREISRSFTVSPSVGTASVSASRVDNSRSPTSTASGGSWTQQLSVTESRTVSMPSTRTPSPTKDALTTTVTNWNPTHSQSQSFSQERPSKSLSVGGTMTELVITNTTTLTHRRQTRGATDPLSPSKTVSRAGGRGGADEEAAAAFSETKTLALTNELSLSSTRSIDLVPWPVMSSTQSVTAASLIAAFTAIFSGTHVGTFGAASTLAAVTMISCNEEHLYSATGLSRLVLSIWYDVGSVASVWGNIGIVVIVTVLHRFAVSIALRRLRPLQQQKKQQLQPRAKGRGKDAIASSNNDDDDILQQAMANVRFPSISIAVMLFLMPGTTYAAASCFADTSNTAYVVTGALGLIICAGATVFSIRLFLAATAPPTISSTGGPLAADDNDDDAIFGEDLDDIAKVTPPLARAAGSTITSHNTAVVLARQHHIAQLRFSVFAAQPHRQPSATATGNLQHDHSVVVAAVSSSSVHQPQPPTSDLPFFVFLKTHSTLLCLVAGLPFRRSSGTTPSSSYSTTSSCTAQYAIMAAWVFMPVVVLLMYRCCRGAFLPLPSRPAVLNMLVILISLVTTGLMVAVAIFFHKDFDRRSSSDDAISALGWVLVALLAVQAVCTIVLPLFQSVSSFVAAHRREQDEEGKGGEGGDTLVMEDHFNEHRSDDGDGGAVMRSLYQEDGEELSTIGNATHVAKDDYRSRTGNNDQHRGTRSSNNNYNNNSNKGNWLHTMPTPKEFLLGVPESVFQSGGSEGEIGGGLRVNAWQRAMWYDSVPLATKLEVARLDALICSALVEREDAARRSLQQAETIRTNHSTNSMGIEEEYDASTLPESAVEFAIVTAMANAEQNKSRKNRGAFETMRKQNVRVALEAMVQRITLVSSIAVTVVAPTSLL